MLRGEAGRIVKDNVTLIEYEESVVGFSNNYFLQVGVVGLHSKSNGRNLLSPI